MIPVFRGRNKRILHCQLKLQLNANGAGLSEGGALTPPARVSGGRVPTKIFKLKIGLNLTEKNLLLSLRIPTES